MIHFGVLLSDKFSQFICLILLEILFAEERVSLKFFVLFPCMLLSTSLINFFSCLRLMILCCISCFFLDSSRRRMNSFILMISRLLAQQQEGLERVDFSLFYDLGRVMIRSVEVYLLGGCCISLLLFELPASCFTFFMQSL